MSVGINGTGGTGVTTLTRAGPAIQTYRIYIKAPPQAIWDALTRPGWTVKYGYRSPVRYNLWRGGAYRMFASYSMREQGAPEVIIEGEVLEADPPRLLAQTWHALFGPETAAEAVTRLTWQIEAGSRGVSTLSLTHQLDDAPITAELVAGEVSVAGGGWSWILSDLKSLLETGRPLAG
jgi:uncharacterized protein YndB with AHSA1/START domain